MPQVPINQISKLEAILKSAVAAILTIDEKGTIDSVNPATVRMFGYESAELVGQNVRILMPEPFRGEHDSYLANYTSTGHRKIIGIGREVLARRKDGTVFPIHLAVSEFYSSGQRLFSGIITDLSERKRVEEALLESERRLAQAQRLEAVGQLTGGIAHDFNNLLTVIIGNLELMDMQTGSEEQRKMIAEAQDAADLGAKLTERLLAFARRSHLEPQIVSINELALIVTSMLRRTLGEQIALSTVLAPGVWSARIDPTQAESAIVNLALNARDAMPRGGKLLIETQNVQWDGKEPNLDLSPGEYVQISVTDTGTGMSADVRERAIEPFFTTKSRGHGTGLGLSMVYGFARQSGGNIEILSAPDQGTTIRIYVPRVVADAEQTAKEASPSNTEVSHAGTVLVVEDDAQVRKLTVSRLRKLGYRTEECADGSAAIALLEKGERFNLVFSDVVMPGGVTGYDVAERARELDPEIRVLLTSGYTEDFMNKETAEEIPLLRKPYKLDELKAALKDILG
jgi:PAS domain S-box-containing protein